MTKEKTQLTHGILEDIKSTSEVEYEFNPADFSEDMDSEIYKDQLFMNFKVGVITYVVVFGVEHTWIKSHNGGDGWNEPSEYECENKHTEIEIKEMFTEDDETDVDFEEFEGELASFILKQHINPYV